MAIRNIRLEKDEILRKKSRVVEKYDARIKELIEDMFDTMKVNDGAGLAAVQVGILKRIIVVEIPEHKFALINPKIVEFSGEQECEEGCLSLPNQFYKIDLVSLNNLLHILVHQKIQLF